jgi:hypothetical protein
MVDVPTTTFARMNSSVLKNQGSPSSLPTYQVPTYLPMGYLPTYLPTIYLAIYLPTYLCRIGTMKSLHGGYIGAYLNWIRRDYLGLHKAYLGNYKNIS